MRLRNSNSNLLQDMVLAIRTLSVHAARKLCPVHTVTLAEVPGELIDGLPWDPLGFQKEKLPERHPSIPIMPLGIPRRQMFARCQKGIMGMPATTPLRVPAGPVTPLEGKFHTSPRNSKEIGNQN